MQGMQTEAAAPRGYKAKTAQRVWRIAQKGAAQSATLGHQPLDFREQP